MYGDSLKRVFVFIVVTVFFYGCSHVQISSNAPIPSVKDGSGISLYPLDNYTDTPRAGMRAANIVEGVMLARGYRVNDKIGEASSKLTLKQKILEAQESGDSYILTGGVSEWRYKTGIDGEPAVSLHLKFIDVKSGQVVWSTTGSDSSWGNTSVGVVAQELITSMLFDAND
jgi:PBP1b-binding outer membrane lipoprotein LpoB